MKSSIFMPSDTSGTGFWRGTAPINLLWPTLNQDEKISVAEVIPPDPNFFAIQNSVMIQRWTNNQQRNLFDSAIYPAAQGGSTNIIYNIDDCMSSDEIPTFNPAWFHYSQPTIQENIKHMISKSDFVLVTTKPLKDYYISKYSIDPSNLIILPNLLPRYWAFGLYDIQKQQEIFKLMTQPKNKIRIGIISSSSHFNVSHIKACKKTKIPTIFNAEKNLYQIANTDKFLEESEVEEVNDDIDDIIEVIRKTSDKFEWISIGRSKNSEFVKLEEENLIQVVPQTNIMHYLRLVNSLNLAAIVAPIKDDLFNSCKSDIKYLESAAVGAMLFTPDLKPYTDSVPESQRYSSNEDLINKLYNLTNCSVKEYSEIIQNQYDYLNTERYIEDGPYIQNQWLDDNINIWKSVLFMARKGVKVHLSSFLNKENS